MSEYQKLPEDFKRKWVAALRSGEYRQGKKFLLSDDGKWCCLGVACSVAGVTDQELVYTDCRGVINRDTSNGRVPEMIMGHTKLSSVLWSMNDDGKSFPEIADWIEANL